MLQWLHIINKDTRFIKQNMLGFDAACDADYHCFALAMWVIAWQQALWACTVFNTSTM